VFSPFFLCFVSFVILVSFVVKAFFSGAPCNRYQKTRKSKEDEMKKLVALLGISLLLAGLLLACGATPEPTKAPEPTAVPQPTALPQPTAETKAAEPALKITGGAKEMAWTEDELKAMDTLDVDYTGKDGTTTTYSGVLLSTLLEMTGAGEGANLVLVAGDGYSAEIALADVQACANCIVAFDPEGGLRSVLPDQSSKLQVKGLAEIQIQGGAPAEAPAGGIPEGAALKITGNVSQEIGWLEADVRVMDTIEAQSTNKQGETSTYTGVPISKLLEMAGPAADATTVVFVGDDGYTAEAPLADIEACADCIVSFRNQGGFSIVAPGFEGGVQVKGVVEIQVK
jgi:hypothetical protein